MLTRIPKKILISFLLAAALFAGFFALTLSPVRISYEPPQETSREDFFTDTALRDYLLGKNDYFFPVRTQSSAIQSYSPNTDRFVHPGDRVALEISVRTGSVPRAFFQKLEIPLSEGKENGQFTTYRGKLTVPKEVQHGLYGAVEFTVETDDSGEVVTACVLRDASSSGKDLPAPAKNADGTFKMVEILALAETYEYDAEDNKNTGLNHYPAGTVDYVYGQNDYIDKKGNSYTFLWLRSGRRICIAAHTDTNDYAVPVRSYSAKKPADNVLRYSQSRINKAKTEITLDSAWKVPVSVTLHPQLYTSGYQGRPYNVTRFTATYVDIRFYYTAPPNEAVNVEDSPLFESADWVRGLQGETILRLHLKPGATLSGYSFTYNEDGQAVFSFRHKPAAVPAEGAFGYSLKGIKISLDAGHGGKSPGATNTIDGIEVTEKAQTRKICDYLIEYLEAMGASVQNVRENDDLMDQIERSKKARTFDPDLFVSIHLNASDSKTSGAEGYYYYPFSQPLAQTLYESLETHYPEALGYKPAARDMRVRYYPFAVTRVTAYPSVLMELGYFDNAAEVVKLCDPQCQKALAKALADGIVNYFK